MAKGNFLNEGELIMSESFISQLHGNASNKTRKWRYFIYGVMKRKIQPLTSRLSQNLVNIRSSSYLKQKTFEYCLWAINSIYIQFFIRACVVCSLSEIYIYIYIYTYIYIYIYIYTYIYIYIYIYLYIYILSIFIYLSSFWCMISLSGCLFFCFERLAPGSHKNNITSIVL